jgi:hypothetical protein
VAEFRLGPLAYNNRKNKNDQRRFAKVLSLVAGRRLTDEELAGKVGEVVS